ncbi:MAG: SPOR domain-containing protein [Deltaproteobacteria bacterium]|nr:SPOR domain-containing protein [Deltaproteobacteria bacterium]MBW2283285.1 SPOR domain-containing protein [Deltaproteobacteria bacterium]
MGSKKSKKKKTPSLKLEFTRTSLLLWSLVFLIFLGWIFALGIFVGKGMLPQSITSTVTAPIDKLRGMIPAKKHPEPVRSKPGIEDPELTFYRKLSSKKEDAAKLEQTTVKRETDQKKPGAEPSGPSEASNQGRTYTVQIASLDREESAAGLVNRLKAGGYPAYAYRVKLDGRFFYRVRCGTFNTLADAHELRRNVAQTEGFDGLVIRTDNR